MDLIQSLTLAGVVLMSASVLGGLARLMWLGGKSEALRVAGRTEIMGSLDEINKHLATLNGSVDLVTQRAIENSERISTIEGAHRR